MADEAAENSQNTSEEAVDLDSLSRLDFGPSWAVDNVRKRENNCYESRNDGRRVGGPIGKNRQSKEARSRSVSVEGDQQASNHREGREISRLGRRKYSSRHFNRDVFKPTVKVDIYPQDQAFDALVQRLKATLRTYQLFEIAHLLLEKSERFVAVVTKKPKKVNKDQDQVGEQDLLYYSVPGHLPFATEEEAINHVLNNNLDLFFDIEEIEVKPPKVNFQMINKCGVTGELLGPPNYHRYREFVQRHYNNRIQGMSYDRFLSKIESIKKQEQIDLWVESMKKGYRYKVRERVEGEPEAFESLDAVRYFLLQYRKDKIVGSGTSIRFAGRDIKCLPKGDIRRSVEQYVEQQRHFPLDTANNIRGRLRRHNFTVYKKGSSGISFVCAVKRKFRDIETVFTDSINELILFLEKNSDIFASKLPKAYLSIDTEKQMPEKLNMFEPSSIAVKSAATDVQATGALPVKESVSTEETVAVSTHEVTEAESVVEDISKFEGALPEEEQKRLNQLMSDLRWLIAEGYVTEYGDGCLFVWPSIPEPKKKEPMTGAPAEIADSNQSVSTEKESEAD